MGLAVKTIMCGGEVLVEFDKGGQTEEFEVKKVGNGALRTMKIEATKPHQYLIAGLELKTEYECRAKQGGTGEWSEPVIFTTNEHEKHQMVCASCRHKFCGSYYKYFCNDEFYVCGDHGCCVCRFYEKKCLNCGRQ